MRIIAGKAKGLPLKTPKGYDTRPTADRVKEAMFSILQNRVLGATVLDLFAGTGALGLEALSRGAEQAIFVEKHLRARQILLTNLERSGMSAQGRIIKGDVISFLSSYRGAPFQLIFLDPPYADDLSVQALGLIANKKLLNSSGVAVWEKSARNHMDDCLITGLDLIKKKQYGDTILLFYTATKEERGDGCI